MSSCYFPKSSTHICGGTCDDLERGERCSSGPQNLEGSLQRRRNEVGETSREARYLQNPGGQELHLITLDIFCTCLLLRASDIVSQLQ